MNLSSYALQLLPLGIGIIVMLMLMSMKLTWNKIRIITGSDDRNTHITMPYKLPKAGLLHYGDLDLPSKSLDCLKGDAFAFYKTEGQRIWGAWCVDKEDILSAVHRETVYEDAVIHGKLLQKGTSDVGRLAAMKLGLVDVDGFVAYSKFLNRHSKVHLLVDNPLILNDAAINSDLFSARFVPLMIENKVEVRGYADCN